MPKLLAGTPIRKPIEARQPEEPIDYQPGEEVDTDALGIPAADVALYLQDGTLILPTKAKPAPKAEAAPKNEKNGGK